MIAKIYCIECNITGEKYIGSTIQKYISGRMRKHKTDNCSCKKIIERGNYKYYVIEEVDESQRYIREQYWMDTTDNCINKQRALGYTNKEYQTMYRQLNKDTKKEYDKQHYQLNKDRKKEYHIERYKYKCSWGGNPIYNNNLLLISLDLFNL